MENFKEELLSRRKFFKKSAMTVLPFITLTLLGVDLTSCGGGDDDEEAGTSGSGSGGGGGCKGSCTSSCASVCRAAASYEPYQCTGSTCKSACSSTCKSLCMGTCRMGSK